MLLTITLFVADRDMSKALERLRSCVPGCFIIHNAQCSINGYVSKLQILRGATRYIRHLITIINNHDQQQQQQQQLDKS